MALTKVSTDGVKNDAIDASKLPANSVSASELADNAVDTNAIADQAVALSKLPHGDGSSDGKFLRANNGADPSFETVTSTTINNNADNRVITGSGTANTLEGESTFTHNPSTFDTVISHSGNTPADLILENTHNSFTGAVARLHISSGDNSNVGGMLELECNGQYHGFESRKDGNLYISDNGTTKLVLDSSGHLNISDGDLKINTSGHGINFSATSDATGMTSELLNNYEEGSWTPAIIGTISNPTYNHSANQGRYIRIGNQVTLYMLIIVSSVSGQGSGNYGISGLPFSVQNSYSSYAMVGVVGYNDIFNSEVNKCYANSNDTITFIPNGLSQSNVTFSGNSFSTGYFGLTLSYQTDG